MGLFDFLRGKKEGAKPGGGPTRSTGSGQAGSPRGGKPAGPVPKEADLIGEVEGYFKKVGVAVIKIKKGPLKVGDAIWIKGHTTDLKFAVDQMQIDHQDVASADKGKSVGIKVKQRCRRGDGVYKA